MSFAAVAGSLAGDVLQSLAQPIIDQTVSQLPLSAQAAARDALNEIVATAGGAAVILPKKRSSQK
ncbi:hypothetical protein L0Z16_19515 [Burkholderia multivorans]|nr:hypothetical protein [Burkholderia multivorans]MCL4661408.1 hypothetical protein [Burkholderia multivorans]MCO1352841.1 hypothetical protein [Burkholderia multivorans]MCO1413314.1 hypothetical protein [Burkholderia multivorans]MCO1446495.1 hypothetical protein [Burkholderia multivorans]UQP47313.1 hypothetical protein L0Z16_19515 [Burkholderia multivorans]